ncbi:hypothetical protein [Ktedonospora formicarum]|uniref:Uncharacterized protein n=1 Tax=Ktedonospora formicarum TaxID=2778364 RepID=A0A8J3MQA3_9CHLR|nr:hypothetical protein [Ktedonospora formicarum]GHO43780.1 hypothetical protein KSX_19430 [Ktedonospora formicarum]
MPNKASYDDGGDDLIADDYAPPANATSQALKIGLIFGIIAVIVNIALAFLSVPATTGQAREATAGPLTYLALGLACLTFLINCALCFVGGFMAGKRIILRRPAFWTGVIISAITYIAGFVERYIPNYPGNLNQQSGNQAIGGIAISLLFLVIACLIGGILSQWGATRATLRHPYYGSEED